MDFCLSITAYNCLNKVGSATQSSVLNNVLCFGSLNARFTFTTLIANISNISKYQY